MDKDQGWPDEAGPYEAEGILGRVGFGVPLNERALGDRPPLDEGRSARPAVLPVIATFSLGRTSPTAGKLAKGFRLMWPVVQRFGVKVGAIRPN